MKDGFILIHKIWSEFREKECCRMVVNVERRKMEKWKENWDEVFMNKIKKEKGERKRKGEREEKKRRERKNKML
jgi:hypothetical protein